MRTVGIAVDDWKLSIFTKRLNEAGYAFSQHPGLIDKTSLLRVECEASEVMTKLKSLVQAAEVEAFNKKKSLH